MKKILLSTLVAMISISSIQVYAETKCWEVSAELLYWRVLSNDLDYAFSGDTNLTTVVSDNVHLNFKGKNHRICPSYEPGFRLGFRRDELLGEWDGELRYTSIDGCKSSTTKNPQEDRLIPLLIHAGLDDEGLADKVKGNHNVRAQTLDALLSYDISSCPDQEILFFWGLQGINIEEKLNTQSYDNEQLEYDLEWKGCVKGGGLQFGSLYRYFYCDTVALSMRGGVSLLVADSEQHFSQVRENLPATEQQDLHIRNDCTVFFPGVQLTIGLDWENCVYNRLTSLSFGYEIVDWFNSPNVRHYFLPERNVGLSTSSNGNHLGFHGFFLKGAVLF